MLTIEQITAKGQEVLRQTLLKVLTGATEEEALLKEHYDSLHELTHISKKTLKRFFKEKSQVGPQTRNLLAAVALGRKEELLSLTEPHQDYYLTFLETLNTDWEADIPKPVNHQTSSELIERLAQYYLASSKDPKNRQRHDQASTTYLPLYCWRKPIQERSFKDRQHQEVILTEKVLFNRNRPILVGEAGMGKTRFACQLCYDWAHQNEPQNLIPIYIDLKHDHYKPDGHGLIGFLLTRYFGNKLDWMVMDFIESKTEHYYFLLDGFDDLLPDEKQKLTEELNAISSEVNYAILSRPYGLNDFDIHSQVIYEIAGLDLSGQEQFIRQSIPEQSDSIKISSLMTFIHGHPVLSVLSRSPLYLYYVIKLAGATKNSFSLLEGVKSGMELQNTYSQFCT